MFKLAKTREHEQLFYAGLYSAFEKLPSSWIYNNYIFDHSQSTLKPHQEHFQLAAYCLFNSTELVSGCMYNFNNNAQFQCEEIGFKLRDIQKSQSCEIVVLYVLELAGRNPYRIGLLTKHIHNNILIERGLKQILATCTKDTVRLYEFFGWQPIDSMRIKQNMRYFYLISYDNKKNTRYYRRQAKRIFHVCHSPYG